MDCYDVELLLDEYLAHELSPSEEAAVREHLEHCESCRRFAEMIRWQRERYAECGEEEVPALPADFFDKLPARRRTLPRRLVSVAAALVLVLGLGSAAISLYAGGFGASSDAAAPEMAADTNAPMMAAQSIEEDDQAMLYSTFTTADTVEGSEQRSWEEGTNVVDDSAVEYDDAVTTDSGSIMEEASSMQGEDISSGDETAALTEGAADAHDGLAAGNTAPADSADIPKKDTPWGAIATAITLPIAAALAFMAGLLLRKKK